MMMVENALAATRPLSAAAALDLLGGWLSRRLRPEGMEWFISQLGPIGRCGGERALAVALDLASRRLGCDELNLSAQEAASAARLRPGFDASAWRVDQVACVGFMLAAFRDDEQFAHCLDRVGGEAGINQSIALYGGLPLYPAAQAIEPGAAAALRCAVRPLFEAIAHRNPYPADYLDDDGWNRMVLKTFLLESPLWPVQGLERRANPTLSGALLDLAERCWLEGRCISPELWRCIGPAAGAAECPALQRVLDRGGDAERLAVALSLQDNAAPAVRSLRAQCERDGLAGRAQALAWHELSPYACAKSVCKC